MYFLLKKGIFQPAMLGNTRYLLYMGVSLNGGETPKTIGDFLLKRDQNSGAREMGRFSQPLKDSTTITSFKTKVTWDQGCECPFGPSQVFGVRKCCGTKREPIVCWFPPGTRHGFLNKFINGI